MTTVENELTRIMHDAVMLPDRFVTLASSINECVDDVSLDYFEFGVFNGTTINYIASIKPYNTIYGFDSFWGLPEDWNSILKKGAFNMRGHLPPVQQNVKLISGWYDGPQGTVQPFFQNYLSRVGFVHIDCDIYSSTKVILHHMHNFLQKNVVIQFDELINCDNSHNHELKAWVEYVNEYDITYQYLYRSTECQVSLRIL